MGKKKEKKEKGKKKEGKKHTICLLYYKCVESNLTFLGHTSSCHHT